MIACFMGNLTAQEFMNTAIKEGVRWSGIRRLALALSAIPTVAALTVMHVRRKEANFIAKWTGKEFRIRRHTIAAVSDTNRIGVDKTTNQPKIPSNLRNHAQTETWFRGFLWWNKKKPLQNKRKWFIIWTEIELRRLFHFNRGVFQYGHLSEPEQQQIQTGTQFWNICG